MVEIERATGRLRICRIAAVDDAGMIVNPLLAEGQVVGGTAQGLGECLAEEATYDDQAQPAGFVPGLQPADGGGDPAGRHSVRWRRAVAAQPAGREGDRRGRARSALLAAVANAVADALGGRGVDPPFTHERLWMALREADERIS